MVKSHRLLEPRLAALRPVDLRALVLPAPERLRAAAFAPPVLLRAGFFAAVPVRLRPVFVAAPPLDLPAALRLPAPRAVTLSRLTILLKVLFCPRAVVS
jgi:hypothetical protein